MTGFRLLCACGLIAGLLFVGGCKIVMQEEWDQQVAQLKQTEAELKEAKGQLFTLTTERDEARRELETKDRALKTVESQLSEAIVARGRENAELGQKLLEAREEVTALRKELKDAQGQLKQLAELRKALADAKAQAGETALRIQVLERDLDAEKRKGELLARRVEELEKDNQKLKAELEGFKHPKSVGPE